MSQEPFISIIILNYNGKTLLMDCIDSLKKLDYPSSNYEIILVDNGSSDGSIKYLEENYPEVKIVQNEINYGFAKGNNIGVKHAKGDYVAFLNNDMRVDPKWLKYLLQPILENDNVVCVGGKILSWDSNKLDYAGSFLTFDGHAMHENFRMKCDESMFNENKYIFFPCGGSMIVSKSIFIDAGGFDEDYFAYYEDVDFGWRLWIFGYDIMYAGKSIAYHKHNVTSSKLGMFNRGYLYEKNSLTTAIKNYNDDTLKEMLPLIFFTLFNRSYKLFLDKAKHVETVKIDPFMKPQKKSRFFKTPFSSDKKIEISDDHLISQLRTLNYIYKNIDYIYEKREIIQSKRKRSDSEILKLFDIYYIPTYSGDNELFKSKFFSYLKPDFIKLKEL